MRVTVVIASHGDNRWRDLAYSRAFPSAVESGADEVLIEHDPDADWRADVRNHLTEQVTDGYVITLDADDELSPGYCDALRFAWISHAGLLLLTPSIQYVRNGRSAEPRFWPECPLSDHNWMVCATAFPASLFRDVGGWRTLTATGTPNEWDDWELWIRMTKAGARIVKVPDAIYVAHVNPRSAANRASGRQRQAWLEEVRDLHWKEEAA